ncbi:RNA pyrophosphohydrolase [Kiloniella antarctica]|uniref:RNA pyrophosphohydrolase n=1 Tax=Kiloniella antarctica TaxID=1550907 RepID=A0ABW5BMD3_9PROT
MTTNFKLTDNEIRVLPYRPCVGIMLLNAKNQVFVAQRIDNPGTAWQMPQGGIEQEEEPLKAALRELEEETGTANAELVAQTSNWQTYDLPHDLVPKIWDGRYRGQKQKWFVFRFKGLDSEINIDTEIPEFSEWKWVDMSCLPDIIVPFKRSLYTKLVEEFSYLIK